MSQKKVLVVDDEFPIRYLVEHQLRLNDFEVYCAKDGPSGLRAARAHKPDLILLDIRMPGMDGFQVCQEIRSDPETAAIPIIFLTARLSPEARERALQLGANDYLTKPFQASDLLSRINANLGISDQAKECSKEVTPGRIVALFSPKGGVGTTTLAIHLSEALAVHKRGPVALFDLDLPLGGVAPTLNLQCTRHIVELLSQPMEQVDLSFVKIYGQRHRKNLFIFPAPGCLVNVEESAVANLKPILETLVAAGFFVVLDLGSRLSGLALQGMRQADVVYVITSGRLAANRLHNSFMTTASELGLEMGRLMPVINELHGEVGSVDLAGVPVARISHATENSHTQSWLKDQGMQKLISVCL